MKRNIIDYHNFSYRETSKEKRKELNIGNIYVNGAVCKKCDSFIRSRNGHDLVTCPCGAVSVDGGSYMQRLIGNPGDYTAVREYYSDIED